MSQRKGKSGRPRAEKRERLRELRRATERIDRLSGDLPGGSPARAYTVQSSAVVDVRARAARCLHCDGDLEVRGESVPASGNDNADDIPRAHGPGYLRGVNLACRRCHAPRTIWFRISPSLPS